MTGLQEKRLTDYKSVLEADIKAQMADEAFAVYSKIKGYLQALADIEQITTQEMQELLKQYTF